MQAMVDVAKEVGADAVAHGCTGKGNDQVCLEFVKMVNFPMRLCTFGLAFLCVAGPL